MVASHVVGQHQAPLSRGASLHALLGDQQAALACQQGFACELLLLSVSLGKCEVRTEKLFCVCGNAACSTAELSLSEVG